jgi:hypothetical protein
MEETIVAGTTAPDTGSFTAKSAISWPSITAGAFVAAAATVILVALGSGVGFASISPWSGHGVSVSTFAASTAIWLIVTQWIAAALGGYIAGRLRTRWLGTHAHEVFFRDTAHGLITWAVATILVAAIAAGSAMSAAAAAAHAVAGASSGGTVMSYEVDKLFRSTNSTAAPAAAEARVEAMHIVANAFAFASGTVPDIDRAYLTEQVAANTGILKSEAQARVDGFTAAVMQSQAQLQADAATAKKATAQASIYLALSMLIGAFIACVAAALGGRIRDQHV